MSRKIDALIAEHVFGLSLLDEGDGLKIGDFRIGESNEIPNYSTSIAEAWEITEEYKRWALFYWNDDQIKCVLGRGTEATASTAPMAICLAALKHLGVKV